MKYMLEDRIELDDFIGLALTERDILSKGSSGDGGLLSPLIFVVLPWGTSLEF